MEVTEVIKSVRWVANELRDEKRGMEAKILRVAADRLASLDEDVKTWMATFDMLNDRENRHGYLGWWREKNGESELCYPDGDEVYKDFFAMKARVEELEKEIERLKHILNCYALQYGTVRDQQEVIDGAKQEVVREIFAELRDLTKYFKVPNGCALISLNTLAELEKKYMGDKSDG